MTLKFISE